MDLMSPLQWIGIISIIVVGLLYVYIKSKSDE